jgi:hypothetical protein
MKHLVLICLVFFAGCATNSPVASRSKWKTAVIRVEPGGMAVSFDYSPASREDLDPVVRMDARTLIQLAHFDYDTPLVTPSRYGSDFRLSLYLQRTNTTGDIAQFGEALVKKTHEFQEAGPTNEFSTQAVAESGEAVVLGELTFYKLEFYRLLKNKGDDPSQPPSRPFRPDMKSMRSISYYAVVDTNTLLFARAMFFVEADRTYAIGRERYVEDLLATLKIRRD